MPVLPGLRPVGQLLAHPVLRGTELPRQRLIEQRHHLIEHISGRLRQHRQQDRIPALRIATLQRLPGQTAAQHGQEPATLSRQHRQIKSVRAQTAHELQLLDLVAHSGCRRLHRRRRQPPQPRHPDRDIGDQQAVQLRAALRRQLMRQPVVGLSLGLLTRVHDAADHGVGAGPDHPRRDQILTPQPKQQGRGIVLHRPRQQELVEFFQLHRTRALPAQVLGHQVQMRGAGLRPAAVRTDLRRIDFQLIRQPCHHHRRRGGDLVRHEPQPRQRAQRHRQTELILRTTPPPRRDERDIGRRQREEPEQLLAADFWKLPQTRQLLSREYLRRHETRPPAHRPTSSAAKPSTYRTRPQPEPITTPSPLVQPYVLFSARLLQAPPIASDANSRRSTHRSMRGRQSSPPPRELADPDGW